MPDRCITLDPRLIVRVLAAATMALIVVSFAGQLAVWVWGVPDHELIRLFDVSRERNVPTFFTVLLMLSAAILVASHAAMEAARRAPDAGRWALLAVIFVAMAYDESSQAHEYLIEPMRHLLGYGALGAFYYAWVIPGMVMVMIVGLAFLGFLRRLPAGTRYAFVLAAALYVGGAIGVELAGGAWDEAHGHGNLVYHMLSTLEEGLEMAGLTVFLRAMLLHVAASGGFVSIRVVNSS